MLLITAEAHAGLNVHKAKHSQATGEFSRTRLLGRNQKHTKPNKQQIKSFPTNHGISLLPSHPEKQSNQPQNPRRKQSKVIQSPLMKSTRGWSRAWGPNGGKGSSYSMSPSLELGQTMSRWPHPGSSTGEPLLCPHQQPRVTSGGQVTLSLSPQSSDTSL